jgi:hypothetical protein
MPVIPALERAETGRSLVQGQTGLCSQTDWKTFLLLWKKSCTFSGGQKLQVAIRVIIKNSVLLEHQQHFKNPNSPPLASGYPNAPGKYVSV